jgi:ssDNA-binding Zn-finger/Zn-ribbon topoisomerase 1
MITKKGKFGNFLGCSKFPNCSYTSHMINEKKNKIYPRRAYSIGKRHANLRGNN